MMMNINVLNQLVIFMKELTKIVNFFIGSSRDLKN